MKPEIVKGFTLVEMMVSLAIFSMVAVVALGAFVKIISANHKAQSLQSGINNLNFALEGISREIRAGQYFNCSTSGVDATFTGSGGSGIATQGCQIKHISGKSSGDVAILAFQSTRTASDGAGCNLVDVYRFVTRGTTPNTSLHIEKAEQANCALGIYVSSSNGGDDLEGNDIIASDVTVTDAWVGVGPYSTVLGSQNNIDKDASYPRVFVRLVGYAGEKEKEKTYFDIQTTVSQRAQKE